MWRSPHEVHRCGDGRQDGDEIDSRESELCESESRSPEGVASPEAVEYSPDEKEAGDGAEHREDDDRHASGGHLHAEQHGEKSGDRGDHHGDGEP